MHQWVGMLACACHLVAVQGWCRVAAESFPLLVFTTIQHDVNGNAYQTDCIAYYLS
jgi:hypothetical protein